MSGLFVDYEFVLAIATRTLVLYVKIHYPQISDKTHETQISIEFTGKIYVGELWWKMFWEFNRPLQYFFPNLNIKCDSFVLFNIYSFYVVSAGCYMFIIMQNRMMEHNWRERIKEPKTFIVQTEKYFLVCDRILSHTTILILFTKFIYCLLFTFHSR